MVKTFSGDINNDLFLDAQGNIAIVSDANAVAEACKSAIEAQRYEMELAYTSGTPNMQLLWGGVPNLKQYEAVLRTTILSVAGVVSIRSLRIQTLGSTVLYTAQIITEFGVATVNG